MIAAIIIFILLVVIGILVTCIKVLYEILKWKNSLFNAVMRNYLFLNEWVEKKRKNPLGIIDTLSKKGYKKIAIYGAGELGIQLYRELAVSNIEIECFIDRSKSECGINVPIYSLNDQIPEIDAVIVSVVHSWKAIKDSLSEKIQGEILFLDELI